VKEQFHEGVKVTVVDFSKGVSVIVNYRGSNEGGSVSVADLHNEVLLI
jgi:hypothetical protein